MSSGGVTPPGPAQALQAALQEASARELKRQEKEREEKVLKFFTEFQSVSYDKAATYAAIITSGGYVGLFTIWGWVQVYLQRWEILSVAFLVGLSLLVFVLWQIYIMTVFGLLQLELANVISAAGVDFDATVEKHSKRETEIRNRMAKLWAPTFWASTVPGVLGGVLLLVACVRHVITGQ